MTHPATSHLISMLIDLASVVLFGAGTIHLLENMGDPFEWWDVTPGSDVDRQPFRCACGCLCCCRC